MTRKTVVLMVAVAALTTATVLAQTQTARWQKLLGNQMLSNVDAGAVKGGTTTARAGETQTQTGMGDLGGLATAAAGSSVSKLSLCADRSFVLSLEDSASVQGMAPVSTTTRVTGSWAISAATQVDAKIKLTPRSASDASVLKSAQLQNFTVAFTGDRTFVNQTRWYRMPAAVCKK